MRLCCIKECNNIHKGKGFCQRHYKKLIKYGDPTCPDRRPGRKHSNNPCSVNGCKRKRIYVKWCAIHYEALRRGLNPHEYVSKRPKLKIRECRIENNICYIPLSNGREAMVDAEDFDLVKGFKWSPMIPSHAYVSTNQFIGKRWPNGRKKYYTLYLHRHIMAQYHKIEGFVIDHINHETFDNRKKNLRVTTQGINNMNRIKLSITNTSGYRGVSWNNNIQKYAAALHAQRPQERLWLGLYDDPAIAAAAWDVAMIRKYSNDILPQNLNFPDCYDEYKATIQRNNR